MEGVAVSGELFSVAGTADWRGLHAEGGFSRLQDFVRRVAVRADRGFQISSDDCFAVRAGHVLVVDLGVAATAGLGDIRFVGRALRILMAEDMVGSVATLAVGCYKKAFFAQRESVNRIDVFGIDAGQAMLLRHSLVAVAIATGSWDIQRIDGGP